MKREAISKRTRFEVFKRDGFKCQYCGSTPPAVLLEVDHIVPVAGGGGRGMDNLATACVDCNRGKGAKPLTSVPQSLKDQAAAVAEREAQLRGYHNVIEAQRQRIEDETWLIVDALEGDGTTNYDRRSYLSIKNFLGHLPFHEVLDAAEIAFSRFPYSQKKFRYFCGICWRKIRGD